MRAYYFLFLLVGIAFWPAIPATAQQNERVLAGQVVGPDGKPLAAAKVGLTDASATATTDAEGNFQLALPKKLAIGAQTTFLVNGRKVGREGFSYRASEHFVSISLKPQTDGEAIHSIEAFVGNNPAKGVKLVVNGQTYTTDERGLVELPVGKAVGQDATIEAVGHLVDSKYYTPGNQQLSLYLKATGANVAVQPAKIEEANPAKTKPAEDARPSSGSDRTATEPSPSTDYDKSFGQALNQLELEKQQLEEQNSRLEKEMRQIEERLQVSNLSAGEKAQLEASLNKVRDQLVANGLAYEQAQERILAVIDRMRRELADSLSTAANEKIQVIEAEKDALNAEFKRDVLVLVGVAAALLVLAGVGFWVASKLRAQKNQLTKTTALLEENLREIQLQKKEISSQRDYIEEKNHYLENAYEEIKQQKGEIERQNQLITTGVRYAESIQAAILPPHEAFRAAFSDHLLVFLPKDIVSGDIYWCSQVGNRVVLAVVDCTGHGVPGAFMSLIAYNMLGEEILKQQDDLSPAAILRGMNGRLEHTLQQEHSLNDDSMDVALCVIEPLADGQFQVRFAGAKRPLLYHQAATGQLQEVRGDRQSLGGGYRKRFSQQFTEHTLQLAAGDSLYLHTDGLTDQANAQMEKLGYQGLQQAIGPELGNQMSAQQHALHQVLRTYLDGAPQRDDITMVGVRL
jgi:serine phosphatase RsbU (regulator of sigma subunit)